MDGNGRLLRFGVFTVAAAGAAMAGCTSLASGADTAQELVPDDPHWGCLTKPIAPPPLLDPVPSNLVYALPIFDFRILPPAVIPQLTVRACQIQDYPCSKAVGLVLSPVDTPAQVYGTAFQTPVYPIVMPYAVDAYIRITAPDYLPLEYYLGGPLLGARSNLVMNNLTVVPGLQVTPITAIDADNLASGVQTTRNPDAAIIAMRTLDCTDQPAEGVTLSLSVKAVPFTFLTGLPTLSALPTTERALAGFANIEVPKGSFINVTVEGTAPNGIAYGKINLTVRGGQVTQGDIRPDVSQFGF